MSLEVLGFDWTVERVRILSVDKTFSSAAARAIWAFFSSLKKKKKKTVKLQSISLAELGLHLRIISIMDKTFNYFPDWSYIMENSDLKY